MLIHLLFCVNIISLCKVPLQLAIFQDSLGEAVDNFICHSHAPISPTAPLSKWLILTMRARETLSSYNSFHTLQGPTFLVLSAEEHRWHGPFSLTVVRR